MLTRANQEPGADLLMHAQSEVRGGDVIHGNDNHALENASEKCSNPFGGVWSPDQNAVAFADFAGAQLAGKLECSFGDIAVRPGNGAVSVAANVGSLGASSQEGIEKFGKGTARHQRAG